MRDSDRGSYFFLANPVSVGSSKDACDALRDSLADEDIDPYDIEEIILRFKDRIKEVKFNG